MQMLPGVLAVAVAGLLMGSSPWPYKLMRKLQFEHWWLVANLISLFIVPWGVTLLGCPRAWEALRTVPADRLIMANALSVAWGVANVLCGLCFLRIGVGLTVAILTGLGVCVGTLAPLIIKGSGQFEKAGGIGSLAGRMILLGLAIMLVGVAAATLAGFGRDRQLKGAQADSDRPAPSHGFLGGLIMTVIAGILSAGMALSFVYSQDPVMKAMRDRGAGEIAATYAVWAFGLFGGGLVNVGFALYLLARNRSWRVFREGGKEVGLAILIGANTVIAFVLFGKGMFWLGSYGAAIGIGIQQAMQITGSQALGFISGEWRGVRGAPRYQMYAAIGVLIVAAGIMAYGNWRAGM